MGVDNLVFSLVCVLIMLTQSVHAVKYYATNNARNTPGGKLFDEKIGVLFAKQTMEIATNYLWKVFEQHRPQDRKPTPFVHCYISNFTDGYAYANIPANAINVSAPGLDNWYYPRDKSKFYFNSLMYHEVTHLFQWYQPNGPPGLYEGIADYMMVTANAYVPERYLKPGAGKRWDEGYGVTERFLEYCASIRPNFVAEINKRLRYSYNVNIFQELLGKPVDQLWKDYKAKYNQSAAENIGDKNEAYADPEKVLPWGAGRDVIIH